MPDSVDYCQRPLLTASLIVGVDAMKALMVTVAGDGAIETQFISAVDP